MSAEWFNDKTVALVGNAQSLFDSTHGELIDSHDVVVRLNKAASFWDGSYPVSHGTKTDVWGIWSAYNFKHELDKPVNIMQMGPQLRHIAYRAGIEQFPEEDWIVLKKITTLDNPTTGLMMLFNILHSKPKSLSVFGFDWKDTPTWTDPERVFDMECPHDYEGERKYVKHLEELHRSLRIYS